MRSRRRAQEGRERRARQRSSRANGRENRNFFLAEAQSSQRRPNHACKLQCTVPVRVSNSFFSSFGPCNARLRRDRRRHYTAREECSQRYLPISLHEIDKLSATTPLLSREQNASLRDLGRQVGGPMKLGCLWRSLRPRQWVKNVFVFAPLLFAERLFIGRALTLSLLTFTAFCAVGSAAYLFNDILDADKDRLHPAKRFRPIASGQLPARAALRWALGLAAGGILAGFVLHPFAGIILSTYAALNVLYSLWLKHQVILDVFTVASGFVLRVVGGGLTIGVPLSPWLLLCTTLLALFLGFSKRRHELLLLESGAESHRGVLAEYDPRFLDMMIAVVTACTLMSYALYTVSYETVEKFGTRGLVATIPFVLYGICRYLYLVYHREGGGDPTEDLLSDRPTIVNLALWAALVGLILYVR
ncbi:MAG: decaprenyl-phosphate phosphoribosyltransferase [Deltaproteobacteria bacterium]|nr:decaprenyl-phosphate phosphoribosyltransferase [Deltaproteobacteria bacterium]